MSVQLTRCLHTTANGRKSAFCVLVLCVLTLLTWIPRSRGPIDLRWDAGVYYVLGTSIAEGKGYRILNEPGEIQDIQYPPLLPAIVALHERALGTSDPIVVGRWLRITWMALSAVYAPLTFLLAVSFLPRPYAFIVALVCLSSAAMFFFSTLLFAELPFAVTTTLFALLRYKRHPGRLARVGVGASAVASYLLRTVGIAALAAWVLDALLRRQFRSAAIRAAVALVPVLMWQGYIHSVQSGYEYTHPRYSYQRDPSMFYNVSYATNVALKDPFRPELGNASPRDLVARFLGNVSALPGDLGTSIVGEVRVWERFVLSGDDFPRLRVLAWWAVRGTTLLTGGLVLGGLLLLLWERCWMIGMFGVLTLAAIGTSPWAFQTGRYLAPLLPFSLIAVFTCVRRLGPLFGPPLGRPLRQLASRIRISPAVTIGPGGLAACLSIFALTGSVLSFAPAYNEELLRDGTYLSGDGLQHAYTLVYFSPPDAALSLALAWLKPRAARGAVVAGPLPAWSYLETGLKTVMFPFTTDPGKIQRLFDSVPVSYVIVNRTGSGANTEPVTGMLLQSGDRWRLIYSSHRRDAEIYARIPLSDRSTAR